MVEWWKVWFWTQHLHGSSGIRFPFFVLLEEISATWRFAVFAFFINFGIFVSFFHVCDGSHCVLLNLSFVFLLCFCWSWCSFSCNAMTAVDWTCDDVGESFSWTKRGERGVGWCWEAFGLCIEHGLWVNRQSLFYLYWDTMWMYVLYNVWLLAMRSNPLPICVLAL